MASRTTKLLIGAVLVLTAVIVVVLVLTIIVFVQAQKNNNTGSNSNGSPSTNTMQSTTKMTTVVTQGSNGPSGSTKMPPMSSTMMKTSTGNSMGSKGSTAKNPSTGMHTGMSQGTKASTANPPKGSFGSCGPAGALDPVQRTKIGFYLLCRRKSDRSCFKIRRNLRMIPKSTVTTGAIPPKFIPPAQYSAGFAAAGQSLSQSMDPTANPCQDFYQFTCGNYAKKNPLNGRSATGSFYTLINQTLTNLTNTLITVQQNSPQWPVSVQTAAKAFSTCISSNNQQIGNGQSILHAITSLNVGNWPIITNNWTMGTSTIEGTIAHLEVNYDVPTLLSSMVDTDWQYVNNNSLFIDQGTLGLGSRQFYIQPIFANTIKAYTKLIVKVATALANASNAKVSQTQIMSQAQAMVNYETKVARRMSAMTDRRNMVALFNIFNIYDLQSRWPKFNWGKYFTNMLAFHNPQALNNLGKRFVIFEPGYIDQLHSDLFLNQQTVVNYMIWRLVFANIQFIPGQIQEAYQEFMNDFDGTTTLPPTKGACGQMILNYMPFAAGYVYVTQNFNSAVRADVQGMISNVLAAFSTMLNAVSWMDTPSLNAAQMKRAAVLQNIAYPNWMLNKAKLDAYYQHVINGLNGSPINWFVASNVLKSSFRQQMYQTLTQPASRSFFLMSPGTVNAWYQPERNSITFPAAILNPPFYRIDYPKVVSYGALGMVMGHELSHGFDDQGSQYNFNGTLAPWMTPSSRIGFANMTQCLISEYNKFCYPQEQNLCVNGINTQGENIADNSGMQAAYKAYQLWVSLNQKEKPIPGLQQYTANQIFFISYANVWCGNNSPGRLTNQLLIDVHSPGRNRVNGVLRNLDIFGTAFNCPRGSNMFPAESQQCHIYRPVPSSPPMPTQTPPPPAPTASHSPGWVQAANLLKSGMDSTQNPCTNFFNFACGNWVKKNPIPPHSSGISTFGQLQNQINAQIISAINSVQPKMPSTPETLVAAMNFYQSCISSMNSQFSNAAPIISTLQGFEFASGGWPMITPNWTLPNKYNPWGQMGWLETYYLTYTLMSSQVTVDYANVSNNALYIDQGSLGLGNRQYYINKFFKKSITSYQNLIVQIATLLAKDANVSIPASQMLADAQAIVQLETAIAAFLKPGSERRNYRAMFNPFTLNQLLARWPYIDWITYIVQLVTPHGVSPFDMQDRFIIMEPGYLDALHGQLQTTSLRTMVNYMGWRYVYDNTMFLGPQFREAILEFKNSLDDHVTSLPPSTSTCVYMLINSMPFAAGRLYIQPNMSGQVLKPNLQNLRTAVAFQTNRVISGFVQMLQVLPWMDQVSKQRAIQKANGIMHNTAFPDWIMNNAQLDAYHAGYIADQTSNLGSQFYNNLKNLNGRYSSSMWVTLTQPANRRFFLLSPALVNAWYQPERNSITFPLATLAAPFYQANFPQAVNFGGQGGGTAGHELTHGFDDEGVQFFTNGTLYTWMTPASQQGFQKMANCVINQYSKYCYPQLNNLCINGKTTQGENIADIGGVQAGFIAYQNYVNVFGPEPLLPGLEQYTLNQIYFMSYAYGWCGHRTNAALQRQLITNVHSPAYWRVNGVLRDIPQFAQAFNCKVGVDPMAPSPANRCTVW